MRMFLTRLGEIKMVINGDITQIDLKDQSGSSSIKNLLWTEGIKFCYLTVQDVVPIS